MHTFATLYTLPESLYRGKWTEASKITIAINRRAPKDAHTGFWAARTLRQHLRGFVLVPDDIPVFAKRKCPHSRLDDEDIIQEFDIYMQSKGKYAGVAEGCRFFSQPEIMARLSLTRTPSRKSVQRFILRRNWRWKLSFRGMYIDGHERADVVEYRQKVFLPWWVSTRDRVRAWTEQDIDAPAARLPSGARPLVRWVQDESTYFEHDRRHEQWTRPGECPVPQPKGEGESIMIADFVSADYGWLRGGDGSSARLVFRAGKERDGYLTNDDILEQAEKAMDILTRWFPNEDHVLLYDNSTTHLKRADNALSARKMPKKTPKAGVNWGVNVKVRVDGKVQYEGTTKKGRPKPMMVQIKMHDATFVDGRPQHLYWEEGTPRAGTFKGMARLLAERGYPHTDKLRAECPDFKCPPDNPRCCCRQLLYNQPDFTDVPSALEELGKQRNFPIMFFPKFHCELSMIEMCWGYSKRLYRLNPPSTSTEQMEAYVLEALESIPLETMRWFSRRCERFLDAYEKGLTGAQAAWAAKKYHGHRVLPPSYVTDMFKANV
ncbi:hypothetical protein PENSPDRAFT_593984 [Peniophora sp. CONT]|nr:hypothetical protein PENSPDRAFT_593984 [Peniophora sp. CONT]